MNTILNRQDAKVAKKDCFSTITNLAFLAVQVVFLKSALICEICG